MQTLFAPAERLSVSATLLSGFAVKTISSRGGSGRAAVTASPRLPPRPAGACPPKRQRVFPAAWLCGARVGFSAIDIQLRAKAMFYVWVRFSSFCRNATSVAEWQRAVRRMRGKRGNFLGSAAGSAALRGKLTAKEQQERKKKISHFLFLFRTGDGDDPHGENCALHPLPR